MRQIHNVNLRQPFIDLGIQRAHAFLAARGDSSDPIIIILNGHEDSGKELLALAFNAACKGERTVSRDIHADTDLSEEKAQPVIFANMHRREIADAKFALQMAEFKRFHAGRQFIVLSNVTTPLLNSLRKHGAVDLPQSIDAHIEVLKANGHSGFGDEGPGRTLIVTDHDLILG